MTEKLFSNICPFFDFWDKSKVWYRPLPTSWLTETKYEQMFFCTQALLKMRDPPSAENRVSERYF